MIRTQIQLPDPLYRQAKKLARDRDVSLADLVRKGLEYMIGVSPQAGQTESWSIPEPRPLGGKDPFAEENWRMNLHMARTVAEKKTPYGTGRRRA